MLGADGPNQLHVYAVLTRSSSSISLRAGPPLKPGHYRLMIITTFEEVIYTGG